MVDRVQLIDVASEHVRLPATKGVTFNNHLTKALMVLMAEFPLVAARQLPTPKRQELATAIEDVFTLADLKKISKKWEPKRPVDKGETQTELSDNLLQLLEGRRQPYEPITLSLKAARAQDADDRRGLAIKIKEVAPDKHVTSLVKKWDKHNQKLVVAKRADQVSTLVRLLQSELEPTPAPPRSKKR